MTPLVDALRACADRQNAPFHTPGHKYGRRLSPELPGFVADLPELPELDNLFAPQGVIQAAQELAAQTFGADRTWFLANGSTCGIQAAVLATCPPDAKIILPRNVHQSAIAALILSGAVPIFVYPDYDAEHDIAHGVAPETIAQALDQHPDAKAVLVVSPTYYGVCSDLQAIAELAHQRQIPLLVDEAHGAHFAFHPALPRAALAAGADLTVQSTHKTLSALTQASMLHVQGDRIDRDRLTQALQMVQSSSPSYLLLASLDAAREQMATQGTALLSETLRLADQARSRLQALGFSTLDACDLTRLTVTGLDGFAADERLHQDFGVTAELPSLRNLTFIISLGNLQSDIDRLVEAFQKIDLPAAARISTSPLVPPLPVLTPRAAFFAAAKTVERDRAVDQISAELVCPYPPGIPVLIPGERITANAIDQLQTVLDSGGYLIGNSDPTLATLRVVNSDKP
jgi:arginine/lysine/ornithine decarboxylase